MRRPLPASAGAAVTELSISATGGSKCTPAVVTKVPVNYGDIAPGASASKGFDISFAGCDAAAKFNVKINFTANSGTYTGSTNLNNQAQ